MNFWTLSQSAPVFAMDMDPGGPAYRIHWVNYQQLQLCVLKLQDNSGFSQVTLSLQLKNAWKQCKMVGELQLQPQIWPQLAPL